MGPGAFGRKYPKTGGRRVDGRVQPGHFDSAILEAFQENHASFGEIFGSFPKEPEEVGGPGCA